MVSTNNKKIYDRLNLLANRNMPFRGKEDPYWKKYISKGGLWYLMPHLLSAFGYAQAKISKKFKKKKSSLEKTIEVFLLIMNFSKF